MDDHTKIEVVQISSLAGVTRYKLYEEYSLYFCVLYFFQTIYFLETIGCSWKHHKNCKLSISGHRECHVFMFSFIRLVVSVFVFQSCQDLYGVCNCICSCIGFDGCCDVHNEWCWVELYGCKALKRSVNLIYLYLSWFELVLAVVCTVYFRCGCDTLYNTNCIVLCSSSGTSCISV